MISFKPQATGYRQEKERLQVSGYRLQARKRKEIL